MAERVHRGAMAARVAALAVVAFAALGSVASAHAVVDDIVPADGSATAEAPEQVVVDFSEPIVEEFIEVEIVASGSETVGEPSFALDPADASRLVVTLPELESATFQVRIAARDAADLHEVVARTTFSVGGEAPQPSPPVLSKPIPVESVARWMFVTGLAAVLGVFVFRSRWPDVPIARTNLVEPTVISGIGLILLGRIGVIVSRAVDLHVGFGDSLTALSATADVRRLPFVVLALACIVPTALRRGPIWFDLPLRDGRDVTVRQTLGWCGAAWLVALVAWGDHSALTGSVEVTTAVAKALHLWGVALWSGVLGVAVVLNAGRGTLRASLIAVSRTAVVAAILTVASGLLLVGRLVVSITALLTSPYGLLLTTKVVVLVAAVALGLRLRSSAAPARRAIPEWVALAVVAVLGSAMATAGPAVEESFVDRDDESVSSEVSVRADDLLVQLQAVPGVPGSNSVQVRVNDTRRPGPGEIVRVTVSGADGVSHVAPVVDGNAFVDDIVLQAGSNPLTVIVERDGLGNASATASVETQVPLYRFPTRVSSAPISTAARTLGLLLVASAAVALVVSRRRRSGEVDPTTGEGATTWNVGEHASR